MGYHRVAISALPHAVTLPIAGANPSYGSSSGPHGCAAKGPVAQPVCWLEFRSGDRVVNVL